MKNLHYLRIEGQEEYKINLSIPNSKHDKDARSIVNEFKTNIKVGERKSIDQGSNKWTVTLDEFSVMYLRSLKINPSVL